MPIAWVLVGIAGLLGVAGADARLAWVCVLLAGIAGAASLAWR